jgi:hypothetical protein
MWCDISQFIFKLHFVNSSFNLNLYYPMLNIITNAMCYDALLSPLLNPLEGRSRLPALEGGREAC